MALQSRVVHLPVLVRVVLRIVQRLQKGASRLYLALVCWRAAVPHEGCVGLRLPQIVGERQVHDVEARRYRLTSDSALVRDMLRIPSTLWVCENSCALYKIC